MDWLNLGLGALGLVGTVGTFYFGVKAKALERQRYRFSWNDVESAAEELAKKCIRSFKADAIVTFSGAGQIAANLAMLKANRLIPVYTIIDTPADRKHRVISLPGYTLLVTTRWRCFVPDALKGVVGKRLAVIDDSTVSGDTLQALLNLLKELGVDRAQVITGVLVCSQLAVVAKKAPDVYGFCVDQASYYFPWGERF